MQSNLLCIFCCGAAPGDGAVGLAVLEPLFTQGKSAVFLEKAPAGHRGTVGFLPSEWRAVVFNGTCRRRGGPLRALLEKGRRSLLGKGGQFQRVGRLFLSFCRWQRGTFSPSPSHPTDLTVRAGKTAGFHPPDRARFFRAGQRRFLAKELSIIYLCAKFDKILYNQTGGQTVRGKEFAER